MSNKKLSLQSFAMMLNYPDDHHILITRNGILVEDKYGWDGMLSDYGKYNVIDFTIEHDSDGVIALYIEIDGGEEQ